MRLIDGEKLKQKVAEWLKPVKPDETVMVALDDIAVSVLMTIEEQPVVPAIQIDRIKQVAEQMVKYHELGVTDGIGYIELIDGLLKEYEGGE